MRQRATSTTTHPLRMRRPLAPTHPLGTLHLVTKPPLGEPSLPTKRPTRPSLPKRPTSGPPRRDGVPVICQSCNHVNNDDQKFCTQCGAALSRMKCANGHVIPDGLTECPFCPRPIAVRQKPQAAARGPRKTQLVTPDELSASGVKAGGTVPSGGPRQAATSSGSTRRQGTVFIGPSGAPAGPAQESAQSPLAGFLVSYTRAPHGDFWPLRYGRNTLGTDANCEVRLSGEGVSGAHAAVMVRPAEGAPRVYVSDKDSTNGTFVNGADIYNDKPTLAHGDRVRVGDVELVVVLVPRGS